MARIVLLSTRYDLGGAPLLASQIARGLAERGHHAESWSLYFHTDRRIHEERTRILFHRPPRTSIDLLKITANLQMSLRKFRPDAFFAVQPLACTLGAPAALLAGCSRRYGGQHNPSMSQRPILRCLERLVGSYVYTGNIAISDSVRQTYSHYPSRYRRKIAVIYNGVPPRGPERDKSAARVEFSLPVSCFLIGTVGVLNEQKNHEFLVDLMLRLPRVHLAIVGDGALRDELSSKSETLGVSERVHMIGAIPSYRVETFYDALDVFVFPSRYEGFGLALVEAMRSRVPVVTSDLPIFHEILGGSDGTFGHVIPTDNIEAWLATIIELRDDPSFHKKWSLLSLTGAQQRFPFERMIDEYERLSIV
jgi:glycosyltransferase involved in cell wall biosynthesis